MPLGQQVLRAPGALECRGTKHPFPCTGPKECQIWTLMYCRVALGKSPLLLGLLPALECPEVASRTTGSNESQGRSSGPNA